jgi:N-acetylglucosamine-6-phosphate deacetylase
MKISGKLVIPGGTIEQGMLEVSKNGIIQTVRARQAGEKGDVDAGESWIVPGFIDVHVHGGYGADVMDATASTLETITQFHARHGTTALLATTVTAPKLAIDGVLEAVERQMQRQDKVREYDGARLLGVHLEGPFISPKWPGAQNPAHITLPNRCWMEEWLERFPNVVRILTLAPEVEGALELIQYASGRQIICAAGHTDATLAQINEAIAHGLSHAVHTCNAMREIHHREPGTLGAIMTTPGMTAEVIADGHHVHPTMIRLLTMVKKEDNLMLITDAMCATGLGDGRYTLGGLDVDVQSGVATLAHGNSLAGSTLTMIDAFRYMVQTVGLTIPEACLLASSNPAKRLGMAGSLGAIQAGLQADFLILSPELEIREIFIAGQQIPQHPL